jgi:bifunctional UDP-N-acetylglucosamine pyrophosphorylase / glucosamine-1-phosphate N-acetyltransferase
VARPVVVILAAGQGTRMRSAIPKLLHPLCGRPMVQWPVAAALDAGAERIIVVDGPDRALEGSLPTSIQVAIQEQPLGTADALKAALPHVDAGETVIVLNGDVPLISAETIAGLAEKHEHQHAAATMATAVLEDPRGYGRVIRGPDGTVERVVETKAPGDASELELHIREVNTGIFAFEAEALAGAIQEIRSDNVQRELYLPDVIPVLRSHERSVIAHQLADPEEMLGINDRQALAEATAIAQRRILERHMLAGVTVVEPRATVVDVDVAIGQDTVVAPFSSIHGASVIAAGCSIGPHATLIDARAGEQASVVHSYVVGAEIGTRVSVGPFAYLRPGTVLREGAKAGTFVEIKNSEVGAGSKVPHLSYIGDTEIGEQTNIGAGTITANYDGYRKHRTRIGSRVKVSVDTAFVAPVTVGDDAYTAAGSVISKDVPDGALGVARSQQRNIDGYAERRKQRAEAEAAAEQEAPAEPASAPAVDTPEESAPDPPPDPPPDAPEAGSH